MNDNWIDALDKAIKIINKLNFDDVDTLTDPLSALKAHLESSESPKLSINTFLEDDVEYDPSHYKHVNEARNEGRITDR